MAADSLDACTREPRAHEMRANRTGGGKRVCPSTTRHPDRLQDAGICGNLPNMATLTSASRYLALIVAATVLVVGTYTGAQEAKTSNKPPLHGRHWVAITGKPLGAAAGALMFARGGNAVDAACAMLGAVATMWGHAQLGRRNTGPHSRPPHRSGQGHQRARRRAHGRDARILPVTRHAGVARLRTTRCHHARDTRRTHGHARRVRHDEPPRTCSGLPWKWPRAIRWNGT